MRAAFISVLRSVLALVAGLATILILVFGTVLLFLPEWTQPSGFPESAPALSGLLALEVIAGVAGAFVAVLLAPRKPTVHGLVLGGLVFILNVVTVAPPDSPWPLIPAILLLAFVPLQTWLGIFVGIRARRRREADQISAVPHLRR
jgi:hypothetical protein